MRDTCYIVTFVARMNIVVAFLHLGCEATEEVPDNDVCVNGR